MISLALDLASDRCTIAIGSRGANVERHVDGARRHAGMVIGLVDDALLELGLTPASIERVIVADGPGSFTGLRVAASVAKAIAWRRPIPCMTAPSLLVRAFPHAPAGGGTVLALTDALRGDLYAGCWQIEPDEVRLVGPSPRAVPVADLARFGPVDVVVAGVEPPLVAAVAAATGRLPLSGAAVLPDARALLALVEVHGGTSLVRDFAAWYPDYGRPAEAQAVWERVHGRALPATPGIER